MHFHSHSIDIVLATYNGESYISEQVSSIINMVGFEEYIGKIIICDDNSNDSTVNIIKSLVASEKLEILYNNNKHNYGPVKNFERGILHSTAEYIMLSDQDDVWDKYKLKKYIDTIASLDKDKPFLIFSDLEVVDEKLNVISPSFLAYQSIPFDWYLSLDNLLIQNTAPGCTMFFNKSLVKKALPLPPACIMHDWWLLIVAKILGEVYFIKEPLIKYRQHGKNQVGAKKLGFIKTAKSLKVSSNSAHQNLIKTIMQMNAFNTLFNNDIPQAIKIKIHAWNYCFLSKNYRIRALYTIFSKGLKKSSLVKTLGLYYLILMGNK